MTEFRASDGQTLVNVCINTYGSLDFFYKLLLDNNIPDANYVPVTGQIFFYDETLVINQQINRTTILNNIKYATAITNSTAVYYVVKQGLPKL